MLSGMIFLKSELLLSSGLSVIFMIFCCWKFVLFLWFFLYYYYFFNAIFAIQSSSQSQTFVYNMHVHIHVLTLINLTIGLYSTCAYGLRNTVGLTLRYWGCTSFDKTSKKKTVNESSGVEESTQIVSAEFQNEMFQSMIKFIQYYPLTNIKERNVQFQG